jgi:hypothetical protein
MGPRRQGGELIPAESAMPSTASSGDFHGPRRSGVSAWAEPPRRRRGEATAFGTLRTSLIEVDSSPRHATCVLSGRRNGVSSQGDGVFLRSVRSPGGLLGYASSLACDPTQQGSTDDDRPSGDDYAGCDPWSPNSSTSGRRTSGSVRRTRGAGASISPQGGLRWRRRKTPAGCDDIEAGPADSHGQHHRCVADADPSATAILAGGCPRAGRPCQGTAIRPPAPGRLPYLNTGAL